MNPINIFGLQEYALQNPNSPSEETKYGETDLIAEEVALRIAAKRLEEAMKPILGPYGKENLPN